MRDCRTLCAYAVGAVVLVLRPKAVLPAFAAGVLTDAASKFIQGAAHGTKRPGANELFLATIGGTTVKLPSIQKVPEVLHAAITGMGDAGVG